MKRPWPAGPKKKAPARLEPNALPGVLSADRSRVRGRGLRLPSAARNHVLGRLGRRPPKRPRRRIDADSLPCHARDDERNAPPMLGRAASMSSSCRVEPRHARVCGPRIGLGAMIAYQRLSVGLRQPFGGSAPARERDQQPHDARQSNSPRDSASPTASDMRSDLAQFMSSRLLPAIESVAQLVAGSRRLIQPIRPAWPGLARAIWPMRL